MHKFLKMAMDFCCHHEYDPKMEYHLCAIVIKGGSVLSVGYNKHTTNSFVEHYSSLTRGFNRDFCLSTHAEQSAILRVRGKIDLQGCDIYVVRRKWKESHYGIGRPCETCQHVLYNYGIKRAFYSIDDNRYGIMKINNPAEEYNAMANDRIENDIEFMQAV